MLAGAHPARETDARIMNLETGVTTADDFWPKGINHRMRPANAPVLAAAAIDGCALARIIHKGAGRGDRRTVELPP